MDSPSYNKSKLEAYILIFIWPYLAFVLAICNYKAAYLKNIVWLFCVYFGLTFVISSSGFDSAFYSKKLLELYQNKNISFYQYVFVQGGSDYFNTSLTYLISIFTGDYRVLYGIYGAIFGFFYSRNIDYGLKISDFKITWQNFLFLLLVIFLNPFWNINGFRFYTAAHILLYAFLHFNESKKHKFILIGLSSIVVHFSFLIPIGVLLIFTLIRKIPFLFLVLFLSSFFIKLDLSWLLERVPGLTQNVDAKIAAYTHVQYIDYINKTSESASWFLLKRFKWLTYVFLILYINLFLFHKKQMLTSIHRNTIQYGILLLSFAQVLDVIPSMGRFITVAHLFCSFYFLHFYKDIAYRHFGERFIMSIIYIPIIIYVIVEIRLGFEYIGVGTLFANPLIFWAIEFKTTLKHIYDAIF